MQKKRLKLLLQLDLLYKHVNLISAHCSTSYKTITIELN